MMNSNRRSLLRSLTMSGVVVSLTEIPTKWTRPVIESVVLPAHAQTTEVFQCPAQVTSSPTSVTVEALAEAPPEDVDGIELRFDGCESLTIFASDDPSGSGDRLLFIDADNDESDTFDIEETVGGNWLLVSSNFPGGIPPATAASDVSEGTYQFRLQRVSGPQAGTQYDIALTIQVVDITDGVEMTVSNVSATVV